MVVVVLPCGSRRCVTTDNSDVRSVLCAVGIEECDVASFSLVGAGRVFLANHLLPHHVDRVTVVASVCGGKGGFGANLRGGPGGLKTKKTTNFDACRDLSGRRLRHAKAEERLREWAIKQAEREKEKLEAVANKRAEQAKKKQEIVAVFAEEAKQLQERTSSALQKGLQARKRGGFDEAKTEAKRNYLAKKEWDVLALADDDDDDDDDHDDGNGDNQKRERKGHDNNNDGERGHKRGKRDEDAAKKADEDDEDFTIHDTGRVTCNVCECVIVGDRFHSLKLEDYDLCNKCYEKREDREEGAFIHVHQTLE